MRVLVLSPSATRATLAIVPLFQARPANHRAFSVVVAIAGSQEEFGNGGGCNADKSDVRGGGSPRARRRSARSSTYFPSVKVPRSAYQRASTVLPVLAERARSSAPSTPPPPPTLAHPQ